MTEYLSPSDITRYIDITLGEVMKAIHRGELPHREGPDSTRHIELEDAIAFCRGKGLDVCSLLKLRKNRVLIVEDDTAVTEMLEDVLSSDPKLSLRSVPSLFSARTIIREFRPHLIFMDANLPDGYGPDFLGEVLSFGLEPKPIVIGITAISSRKTVEDMTANGAREVMIKPIPPDKLLNAVSTHLSRKPETA